MCVNQLLKYEIRSSCGVMVLTHVDPVTLPRLKTFEHLLRSRLFGQFAAAPVVVTAKYKISSRLCSLLES